MSHHLYKVFLEQTNPILYFLSPLTYSLSLHFLFIFIIYFYILFSFATYILILRITFSLYVLTTIFLSISLYFQYILLSHSTFPLTFSLNYSLFSLGSFTFNFFIEFSQSTFFIYSLSLLSLPIFVHYFGLIFPHCSQTLLCNSIFLLYHPTLLLELLLYFCLFMYDKFFGDVEERRRIS